MEERHENRRCRRNSGELGGGVAEIAEHECAEHPERDLDAEVLADEVREPLARHRTHARAHLLRHDERDRGRNEQP